MIDYKKLEAQLIIDEGKKLSVYLDSEGLPTVGIGHLIQKVDYLKIGDSITDERCSILFRNDVDIAVSSCKKLMPNFGSYPDEVQQILCNMMFNMGIGRLSGFKKMLAAIDAKNYIEAANQMKNSRWYTQTKGRAIRLTERMRAIK